MAFFNPNIASSPRPTPRRNSKQGELASKLHDALVASNQAGESFQKAGQKTGSVPLADIKDCFHEASDDHKGSDCSHLGKRASQGLKSFSQSRNEISTHGRKAQRAQAECTKKLEEANRMVRQAGLPPEVSQRLTQAIQLGSKSRNSAQILQREMNGVASTITTLEVSAFNIEMDEDASMGGRDVSQAAREGEAKTDSCAKPLQQTAQSANQGAMTQAEVSHLIQNVINTVAQATAQAQQSPQSQPVTRSAPPNQTVTRPPVSKSLGQDPAAAYLELDAIMGAPIEQGSTTQTSSGFVSLKKDPPFTTSGFINSQTLHSTTTTAAPSILAFDFDSTQL